MAETGGAGCLGTSPNGKKAILAEFRDFVLGGNFINVATALVLALALEALIKAFVSAFVTPIIGVIGSASFNSLKFTIRGSDFVYGLFLDALLSFTMVMTTIFCCIILPLQRHGGRCAPAWIQTFCQYCCSQIPAIATKCPHCTSEVTPKKIYRGRKYEVSDTDVENA